MVLIEGTRGTGKRALARAIHASSVRRRKMFRVFNCRSCSPLEMRRLFLGELHGGRSDGGRYIRYLGLFEEVTEGTLYLEEVEYLPLDMQRIVSDVIRSQAFRPIGSEVSLPFRGRVILSTCSDEESDGRGALCPELAELEETQVFHTDGPRN